MPRVNKSLGSSGGAGAGEMGSSGTRDCEGLGRIRSEIGIVDLLLPQWARLRANSIRRERYPVEPGDRHDAKRSEFFVRGKPVPKP